MNRGVFGIDLGNDNCVVGVAMKGHIKISINDFSNRKTPSIVAFTDKKRAVGENALFAHAKNWKNTIFNIKTLLQTPPGGAIPALPFNLAFNSNSQARVEVRSRGKNASLTLTSVAAALLASLLDAAQRHCGVTAGDCVMAVPATLATAQRRAVVDAARVAGLNLVGLISESAAAALSYGIANSLGAAPRSVLFVDVGHSAATASLVIFNERTLRVQRVERSPAMGGAAFDAALLEWAVRAAADRHGFSAAALRGNCKAMIRLQKAVEKVKCVLSVNKEARIYVESLLDDIDVSLSLKRCELEGIIVSHVAEIVSLASKVVDEEHISKSDLHSIELIGGSSRIPLVRREIESYLGRAASLTCNSDEAVAEGCTFRSAMISPLFRARDFRVTDCFPYAVRLSWGPPSDDFASASCRFDEDTILFEPFSPLPKAKMVSFARSKQFQAVLSYADPTRLPHGTNPFISRFLVSPPPTDRAVKGAAPEPLIKVKIVLDANGFLVVRSVQLHEVVELPASEEAKKDSGPAGAPRAGGAGAEAEKMETDECRDGPEPMDTSTDKPRKEPKISGKQKDQPKVAGEKKDKKGKAAEDEPMEKASEESKDKKGVKKRKIVKTNVPYTMTAEGATTAVIQSAVALEAEMRKYDKLIDVLGELKNDLESLVIETKPRLSGDWKPFVRQDIAVAFSEELDETESWLYCDKTETPDCIQALRDRIARLSAKAAEIQLRKEQSEQFAPKMALLERAAKEYEAQLAEARRASEAGQPDRFAHLAPAELDEVQRALESSAQWCGEASAARRACPLEEVCEFALSAIESKTNKLRQVCDQIFSRPKPAKPAAKSNEGEKPAGKEKGAAVKEAEKVGAQEKKPGAGDEEGEGSNGPNETASTRDTTKKARAENLKEAGDCDGPS